MADEKTNDMEIQTPPQGESKEPPTKAAPPKSALEEAKQTVQDLKVENDRREAILKREEDIYAHNLLAGKTEAGDIKLTPEQIKQKQAEQGAKEIVNAFK